jgi:hypothetical protein
MTTTNALIGATLALIIVAVALAAGRYLPAGWAQRFRRMIPDNFKRDPLGSVTAAVNDPKSILKSITIPDSVRSLSDMVPQSIRDKVVPKELQDLVGIAPSATVPRIEPEASPPPPASSRKIDIAPSPPLRRAMTPEPIQEEKEKEKETEVEEKQTPIQPLEVNVEAEAGVVTEDGGIVTKKEEVLSTILKIDPADLEAVKAFLESRSGSHVVLQSNSGSITEEARL